MNAALEAGYEARRKYGSTSMDSCMTALDRLHDDALVASIDAGAIHVWHVALDAVTSAARARFLTPADHLRVARYVRPLDRDRRLHARCALRAVLERYAGVRGARLDLAADANGKPGLPPHHRLQCSLSHTGGAAVIGIARQALGIDIEPIHVPTDLDAVACEVMTAAESGAFNALSDEARARAFLTCWTRKEACLKALGSGLLLDPREVNVGIAPTGKRVDFGLTQIDVQSIEGETGHLLALGVMRDGRETGTAAGPVLHGRFPVSGWP